MKHRYFLLSLLMNICAWAQVSISVQTEKGRRDFAENEPIVINVLLEVSGKNMTQQTPLRLFSTSKFEVLGSGSEQNTFVDEKTGYIVNQTLYQTIIRAKKTGKYKIGSASVTVNDKLYYTEPFEISINETAFASSIMARNEVSLRLSVDNLNPFEREKITATVTAYSKNIEAFQRLKKANLPSSPHLELTDTNHTKQEIEQKEEIHSQVIAVFSLIPEVAGTIKVKPVSIEMIAPSFIKNIVSNALTLQVKPLPKDKPQHFSDAVGDFQMRMNTPKGNTAEQGKLFPVEIILEGIGDIKEKGVPTLKSNRMYTVYPPKILQKQKSKDGKNSYRIEYLILPKNIGKLKISSKEFGYFNTEEEKYTEILPQSVFVEIKPTQTESQNKDITDKETEYTPKAFQGGEQSKPTPSMNEPSQNLSVENQKLWWIGGIFSLTLLSGLLWYRKKKSKTPHLLPKTEKIELKSLCSEALDTMNLAITQERFSDFFTAFFEFETQLKQNFSVEKDQELYTVLEHHHGKMVAEKFQSTKQSIAMEKYAPQHQPAHLYELVDMLKEVAIHF